MEAHWSFIIMVMEWVLVAGKPLNKLAACKQPSNAFFEVVALSFLDEELWTKSRYQSSWLIPESHLLMLL